MSDKIYESAMATHPMYNEHIAQWKYLLNSYVGGQMYKEAGYLTKYINETDDEYHRRIESTYLNNQCNSIVSVYNSFLFRNTPTRELGSLDNLPESEAFLKDADYDGRSFDSFMEEVSTWSSVFGHSWILVVKPNINAVTRADEIAQGIRPYVSQLSPLVVLDWSFKRSVSGKFRLVYLKYIEEVNGNKTVIKEWTDEEITSITVDTRKEKAIDVVIEPNGLGQIPAVIAYNKKTMRGEGSSDIADIADAQKYDYNLNSEVEQSIRIDSHPSLVKTKDTQAGAGAGSLIEVPDDMEPQLKPYTLEFDGANIKNIIAAKETIATAIDTMANTGSVRATETVKLSGVAMETEFQLLNAKLSSKANNLELAEEQVWRLFATYQNKIWDGTIDYPGSFSIRDTQNEYKQLESAKKTTENEAVVTLIDRKLVELLGEDADVILGNTSQN